MNLKLNKLTVRNFKGFKSYELEAEGQDINVFGDNGTGKTSLYDAFLWVLFGKNSVDQATFDWKPLDKSGNEINHLETEVIAEIEVDGKDTKLSRMTEEKWTKKRGSAVEMFDGHTTTYKIDDLTVKKKEYEEFLATLIDEDLFKLLTNVSHFPEKLKWQDRRQTLIDMVGDVTDSDVIDKNKELEPLKELIEERPADELKQLTEQQMKQINKDIKAIPDRIDEVDRGLPDISKLDRSELLEDQKFFESRIEKLQEQIAEVKNSDYVVEARNEIAELRTHYRELELDYKEELEKELEDILNEKENVETEIRETNVALEEVKGNNLTVERAVSRKEQEIKELESDREKSRVQFYEIRDRQMDNFETHQTTCPTCGQDLPEEELLNIRLAYEKEVEAFNTTKALELKENKEKGITIAKQIEDLKNEIDQLNSGLRTDLEIIADTEKDKERLIDHLNDIESEINKIREGQNPFENTEKAQEIKNQASKLQEQIDSGQSNVEEKIEEINQGINKAKNDLAKVNDQLSEIDFHTRQSKRKEELIQQEQELSVRYGELEQRLYLLEEFTRTKVDLLTDTINNKFKLVKFKLFEEQINGGLKETCEVTVDGNNYSTGLNNAMRINAGLDIINTLMDYYDTYVPVFVDNAESINDLLEIDTQLITLSVSKHQNLRVEVA
jgi:DNA repair exonuclease SbcCD ATPase subunit